MSNENKYKTSDLALAAAISLFTPLETIEPDNERRGKFYFVFNHDDRAMEIADKYYTDELEVSPRKYYQELRAIKARMYGGQDGR